jgi:hypothetical protein
MSFTPWAFRDTKLTFLSGMPEDVPESPNLGAPISVGYCQLVELRFGGSDGRVSVVACPNRLCPNQQPRDGASASQELLQACHAS